MISREVYGTSGRQVEHFWFWGTSEDFPSEFWEGCERFPSGAWVLPGVRVKKQSLPDWRLPKGGLCVSAAFPKEMHCGGLALTTAHALWSYAYVMRGRGIAVRGRRWGGKWASVERQVGWSDFPADFGWGLCSTGCEGLKNDDFRFWREKSEDFSSEFWRVESDFRVWDWVLPSVRTKRTGHFRF